MEEPWMISDSQEELLRSKPFFGELTPNSSSDTPTSLHAANPINIPSLLPITDNLSDSDSQPWLISESQEQLLRSKPFFGEQTLTSFADSPIPIDSKSFFKDQRKLPATVTGVNLGKSSVEENVVATEKRVLESIKEGNRMKKGKIENDGGDCYLKLMKVFEEKKKKKNDEEDSLFDDAIRSGVNFPRVRWWPEHFDQHGKDTRNY